MAEDCRLRGVKLYKVRPKVHGVDHCIRGLLLSRENPYNWAFWMEENLMGLVRQSVAGAHTRSMLQRGMQRWLLRLWAEFA